MKAILAEHASHKPSSILSEPISRFQDIFFSK